MTKPDDVSQQAWDAATSRVSAIFGVGDYSYTLSHELARAIDAAVAAEREACATTAEERHRVWGTQGQIQGIEVEDDISACSEIAAAIRARSLQADNGLEPCDRCFGGGEVMSSSISRSSEKHLGTFSSCPDCKGTGVLQP